jgi:hypothetical protein
VAGLTELKGLSKGQRTAAEGLLADGERILRAWKGMWSGDNESGALICTDRGLITVHPSHSGAPRAQRYPWNRITGVRTVRNMLYVQVHTMALGPFHFSLFVPGRAKARSEEARELIETALAEMRTARTAPVPVATNAAPTKAMIDELERLATLHEQGALSDDEFATAKTRLLQPPAQS